ncbi:MAG: Na+/H+ antiporter subunit E [Lachnospiraceae bacterium]|nr:Na+/H+ antiporter subunit E [Lachnospiraceae bacterium]
MFFLFLILWIILNGRITLEIVLFGIAIAAAGSYATRRILGLPETGEKKILRNLPLLIEYVGVLIWEIIKASLAVMKLSVSGKQKPDPVIIEFNSGFHTALQNVLLANSITLTPGTFTLFQEDDHFVIHCLRPEYAEGIESSSFVKLLSRIKD